MAGGESQAPATRQMPIELIQARSLIASLDTAAFLVQSGGTLLFYNEAAEGLLGLRFAEAGPMGPDEWGTRFEPRFPGGEPMPVDDLPLTIALRDNRAGHAQLEITGADGKQHAIEVSAIPIEGGGVRRGAFAIFWPAEGS